MHCEQRQRNESTILECFGRFDEEDTNHFIQTLEQLQIQGLRNIVLNLSPIFYLDPKVLNLLLFAQEFLNSHGGTVSIVSPLSSVRNELIRGKIPDAIPTFESLYSALHRPHAAYSQPSQ
ncbi:MAG: STAS domain-containing protein [Nitrospirota bacterium]|nr:STAS domain-containing protein [Nitrospirota bacterium]